jgi:hypothetical protein
VSALEDDLSRIAKAAASEPTRARLRWETPWLTPAQEADALGEDQYEREVRGEPS